MISAKHYRGLAKSGAPRSLIVSLSFPLEFFGICWTRQIQFLFPVPFQFFGSSLAPPEHGELKFLISVPAQLIVSGPSLFLGSSLEFTQNLEIGSLFQFLPSSLGNPWGKLKVVNQYLVTVPSYFLVSSLQLA